MKNIIIIGSRGYNYNYGGWETFVTEFVNNSKDKDYKFYIPYLDFDKEHDKKIKHMDNVEEVKLYTRNSGFTTMFKFTIKSIRYYIDYLKNNKLENTIMIILGCKIGPLMPKYYRELNKLGVKVIMNPDGLEWKRDKWNSIIKKCFKISESFHIKYTDYVVCDSKSIKGYIDEEYGASHKTNYIAYGTYLDDKVNDRKGSKFFKDNNIKSNNYYLYVGRFVPENNIETIIREFINSNTTKKLLLVTNYEKNGFYEYLREETNFDKDERIVFLGPVYDKELLTYLRVNAYGYIHGHSAGGTNPSLLEALGHTKLNILYDVSYNQEVGNNSCFYFTKTETSLAHTINRCDELDKSEINELGKGCISIIKKNYTWSLVVDKYDELFNRALGE